MLTSQMQRTDQDYTDGFALDMYSPVERSVMVTQKYSSLPGNFVTGSTGEGFIALSEYSYLVKVNETANDLIAAKVEVPFNSTKVKEMGIDISNLFAGKMSHDKKSWVVVESQRNVHV